MTIETGDRYLDLLSTFIDAKTDALLHGGLPLKLNPVGLHYVQTRLEALKELEALRIGAPVDYLRAYVADLGDHRALEKVRHVLRQLSSVKVVAMNVAPSSRDPTPITLLSFSRLRSLELRGCDLSTSAARGLLGLRPNLEKLVCYNSADALRHIFAERTKEIQDAPVWSRLAHVSCLGNGMLLMDESLQLLPALEALDLSRNRFAKVSNLQKCSKLKYLDIGFNRITSVSSLSKVLCGVTKLVLRNNALVSTRGLQRIASLEALDLSYNLISNFREVELLGKLPALCFLWLQGNPLTFSRWYRRETLSYFSDPIKVVLDGKQTSKWESCAARRLVAYRLKHRSKYGAFTPAQTQGTFKLIDSGEIEDTSNRVVSNDAGPLSVRPSLRARKKNSRMASIVDVTGIQTASSEVEPLREDSFSSLASLDSSSLVPSIPESKEQIEETVQDLMQRAEVLKRAGSSSWLKDLNVLLETEGINKPQILEEIQQMDSNPIQRSPSWQKKRRRRSMREGSFTEAISVSKNTEKGHKSEEHGEAETSPARSTHDSSARRVSKEALARYGSDHQMDESYLRAPNLSTTSLDELQRSFVDGEEQSHILPISPNNGGEQSGISRLAEDLGKMFASSSSSPPQFNQDLLQRRHTLERERLQVPPPQDISPLYDSESSSTSGTMYSHLSDSSDSPRNSPSAVWHPFRFDHSQNPELLPSAKAEKSDSDDNLQAWSDTEAPQRESPKTGEAEGKDHPTVVVAHTDEETEPDRDDITPFVHTEEVREPDGKGRVSVVHTEEGTKLDGKSTAFELHSGEGTESHGKSTAFGVHPDKGNEPDGKSTEFEIHPEEGKEASGRDTASLIHTEEQNVACDSQGNQSASSSSKDGPSIAGNTSPQKDLKGGDEKRLNPRSPRNQSQLQPKSKASRRIVNLESFPEVSNSPQQMEFSPRGSNQSTSVHHQSTSLGIDSATENMLQRSQSSSAPFLKPSSITRSSSMGANVGNQRTWSRTRNEEESLSPTSRQKGESHEAADSSLHFHRVHHPVGQCA